MRVLGLARANNAAIMLAAFGDVPGGAAGLRAALLTGAPALGAERLALLVQVRPQYILNPKVKGTLLAVLGAERLALLVQVFYASRSTAARLSESCIASQRQWFPATAASWIQHDQHLVFTWCASARQLCRHMG